MNACSRFGDPRRVVSSIVLTVSAAFAALAVDPAGASAAPCPVNPGNATAWIAGGGDMSEAGNWSNGTPTGTCAVTIEPAGSPTITASGGFNMKSLTLGGAGSTPRLVISAQSPNTNLDAQPEGITIAAGASVTLTCAPQPTGCLGGASGGAGLIAGPSPLQNAGTIKVDADSGTGASINGLIANTGTIAFENAAKLGGQVVNEGTLSVAAGATVINSGSSCGDTTVFVKNYAGGTIAAAGSGAFQITNYEQGDGTATGTEPIRLPCGSLKYTGDGSSLVRAYGGFNLSGEMREGQSLEISPESANTNAVLQGPFTNNGSIALTCFSACEPGAGAGFNVNDEDFVNAGTFTIAAASGTGAGLGANTEGTITNTGTLQFDQSGGLGGPVTNKGALNVADEKTATSSGSSCGDTGSSVTNDAGGSINGAGSGMLSVLNYVQGDGITTGTAPVVIPCGSLKYTGSGAGTVQVNGTGTPMTGSLAAGQVLRLMGGVTHAAPFANAGKIVFDQTSSSPEVNVSGGALVNTGTLETTGPSGNNGLVNGSIEQTGSAAAVSVPAGTRLNANNSTLLKAGRLSGGGTLGGSLENTGGTVAPGASPGTLTVTGSYVQGAGGNLEAEIEGTGAAQFDQLVVGGDATLGGTLTLVAAGGYPGSSAVGDSVDFLDYGGSRSGEFATVVAPALPCPRQMGVAYDDTGKQVMADVSGSGQTCGGGGGGGGNNPPPTPPETTLKKKPKGTVKTKKSKIKVKFGFSSDVAGASFECKLDRGAFKACKSPKSYKVKVGSHVFKVAAVSEGVADPTPAVFRFKVKASG